MNFVSSRGLRLICLSAVFHLLVSHAFSSHVYKLQFSATYLRHTWKEFRYGADGDLPCSRHQQEDQSYTVDCTGDCTGDCTLLTSFTTYNTADLFHIIPQSCVSADR
jgi:hypothetical protein